MYEEALPETEHFFEPYTKYLDFAEKAIAEGASTPIRG